MECSNFSGCNFGQGGFKRIALCFGLIAAISAGMVAQPAAALELENPSTVMGDRADNVQHPLITKSPPTASFDDSKCLALLKNIQHNGYSSQSVDRDRRAAGQAAAISLVFGVRFALGPKEVRRSKSDKSVQFEVWKAEDHSGAQALAVADYRRCKNREALQAISDFRWER